MAKWDFENQKQTTNICTKGSPSSTESDSEYVRHVPISLNEPDLSAYAPELQPDQLY